MPSIPVTSDEIGVPGRTSQERSSARACPTFSQPASCAVYAAVISRPAATTTSTAPVTVKNRARFNRTPPRWMP